MATAEHTINVSLGEVLQSRRRHSWRVHGEETRTLQSSKGLRPDILIEEASQWPVVIEAEKSNHISAEQDAMARLGEVVNETGRRIESAIALVYPEAVHDLSGESLRDALDSTDAFEYALFTRTVGGDVERLPESGWLTGSIIDLAMLAHRASMPAPRVERLGQILENGITHAAARFTEQHASRNPGEIGPQIAALLGQADDQCGQTRRMAMTVLINALIFHESLADAEFHVGEDDSKRRVRPMSEFQNDAHSYKKSELLAEWDHILEVNYWPIFATAKEILNLLPSRTTGMVLNALWDATEQLVQGGVTKSHDLTGVIFQRLIADRKFLATFYTRPAAAALLAGLAIPADRAPGGAEWGDESIHALQVGDFACGTGTLLSAAYQRISLLHELHGGDPKKLHQQMMKNGLVGLDVLNIAVHLTAASLAGSHPDVPFEGECLLTMPYGGETAAVGSLELLAKHVQPDMIRQAAAQTAGGRSPEDVRDLVSRIGHGKFDLVVMNPPFTRSVGQEGKKIGKGNPAFAGFDTPKPLQAAMQKRMKKIAGKQTQGAGNAGLGSYFGDLAVRKLNSEGQLAFVLPLSAAVGESWAALRDKLSEQYAEIAIVSIAQPGSFDRSFSADTGMAEILLLATPSDSAERRITFVSLNERPRSATSGATIANLIGQPADTRRVDAGPVGGTALMLGDSRVGEAIEASPTELPSWNLVGINDMSLAQTAYQLKRGGLPLLGRSPHQNVDISCAPIGQLAEVGPYHADIYWSDSRGRPRGPFDLLAIDTSREPTYPILWEHKAKRERRLIVDPDKEGQIKDWEEDQEKIDDKALNILVSATRAHYNRDLQFNSQSLIVAMTARSCIGGMAWPSVILDDPEHEFAFSLWCNSTLGLLLHWWGTNKTQSGRGRTSVTGIPNIPTLDTRELTDAQHAKAREMFEGLKSERFLPFDQIVEDKARAKLDRAILVDVLGLPETLVETGGPIDLIRRKLAREPQIHGGKKSRVVFTPEGEKSEKREDR